MLLQSTGYQAGGRGVAEVGVALRRAGARAGAPGAAVARPGDRQVPRRRAGRPAAAAAQRDRAAGGGERRAAAAAPLPLLRPLRVARRAQPRALPRRAALLAPAAPRPVRAAPLALCHRLALFFARLQCSFSCCFREYCVGFLVQTINTDI